jgi:hypothetical protein
LSITGLSANKWGSFSEFYNLAPGFGVEMQHSIGIDAIAAIAQASGIKIQSAIHPRMMGQMSMTEQGNIDLAAEFMLDHLHGLQLAALAMNEADLPAIQFNELFKTETAANVRKIAIAADRLQMAEAAKILHDLEGDNVSQMDNNILPVNPLDEIAREDMAFGQMSIRNDPNHNGKPA